MIPDLASSFPGRHTISVQEAASVLGVSDTYYYAQVRRGNLPGLDTGGDRVVVPLHQLDAYLRGEWAPPTARAMEAVRIVTGIGGER